MGISRAASFVIAYLMKHQKMNFMNAIMCFFIYIRLCSQKRKIIFPNPGFIS